MAKINPALPFDSFSGKLSQSERIVMRTRYGRTQAYAIKHPYAGPISANRQPIISAFSAAVSQCRAEMSDSERFDYWQKRYLQYQKAAKRNPSRANADFIGTNKDKFYNTLRGFIIASLSIQLRSAQ